MTTTADVTAPPARLTTRQMTLRLAKLARTGLPSPVAFVLKSVAQLNQHNEQSNAHLAAAGLTLSPAQRPAASLMVDTPAELGQWARALDLNVRTRVYAYDGHVTSESRADGVYAGWDFTVGCATILPTSAARPRKPGARQQARARIVGRLV